MATVRLTAAQALVRYLAVQHSERDGRRVRLIPGMFGIFGHGNIHGIGQALLECGEDLPLLPTRNEQAMVHIAAAYAKEQRRLSTYACTASVGPGATNMITGAALATVNRLPVLLLPADYFARRRPGTVLQELEHPTNADVSVNDAFRPVSRYFDRIEHPEQLLDSLPDACRVLTSPSETGAVVLSLPQDIQVEAHDFPAEFFEPHVWTVDRRPASDDQIKRLLALLRRSRRPVIVAGGGVRYSEAEAELSELAHRCGIPVVETFAGKGSMTASSWESMGGMGTSGTPAANEILRDADLVLCLGSRMTDTQTGSRTLFQNPDVRFAAVNVVERDAVKLGAVSVVADVREALRALLVALEADGGYATEVEYRREAQQLRTRWTDDIAKVVAPAPGALSQAQVVTAINAFAGRGDIAIGAAGTLPTDLLRLWDTSGGRDCYLEFGFSCMTHEIPAGIGVRLARAAGEVYVLVGDGSFLMNPTELATAMQLGLKVTVVVVENRRFASIFGLQQRVAGSGDLGNEFVRFDPFTGRRVGDELMLDLARIAEGLGVAAVRADTHDALLHALHTARDSRRSTVIVVAVDVAATPLPASGAWRDIPIAEVAHDAGATEREAAYVSQTSLRRSYLYRTESERGRS